MCLVETAEQLVAFGHDGLRSSLGQNALGPLLIGLIHTAPVCSATTGFYTDRPSHILLCCRYSVTLKADGVGVALAGYQGALSDY